MQVKAGECLSSTHATCGCSNYPESVRFSCLFNFCQPTQNLYFPYTFVPHLPPQVQVGSRILAFVKVVDGRGVVFPPSQHKYMNLLPYTKSSYIDVR